MTLRKSLVAAATALTVSAAGVGVASAEDATPDTNLSILAAETVTPDANDDAEGSSFGSLSSNDDDENGDPSEGGSSDIDVDNVASWIGVFTAVIGAASALAGFISKFMA